jgi:hypothetical protein
MFEPFNRHWYVGEEPALAEDEIENVTALEGVVQIFVEVDVIVTKGVKTGFIVAITAVLVPVVHPLLVASA